MQAAQVYIMAGALVTPASANGGKARTVEGDAIGVEHGGVGREVDLQIVGEGVRRRRERVGVEDAVGPR